MTFIPRIRLLLPLVLGALAGLAAQAQAQAAPQPGENDIAAPVEPLRAGMTGDQVLALTTARNELRNAALRDYTAIRTYQVADLTGKVHAQETGRMDYHAPDQKTFTVTSESGSVLVRHLALKPLIAGEIEAAAGKQHHDSSITPSNYTLQLLGEQRIGPHRCYIAQAVPKRRDKYLFEGKIWIDVEDYAIVRIEGHPAKRLSFWIERADFVREYEKIDQFWLSQRDETFVQVRLYGRKVLTIDHENYALNRGDSRYAEIGPPPGR